MKKKVLVSVFLSFAVLSFEVTSATITGTLLLTGRGAKKAMVSEAVIFYKPNNSDVNTSQKPAPADYQMSMQKKKFYPRVLPVPVGSQVKVPNFDKIAHNAFSPSSPNEFDIGTYSKGESREFVVQHPGVIKVFCNVHYHMVAYVVVVDTPYYTQPDDQGVFQLDNIPPGPGKLTIWHENGDEIVSEVDVVSDMNITFKMKVAKRRVPKHKNKFGKSYSDSLRLYDF